MSRTARIVLAGVLARGALVVGGVALAANPAPTGPSTVHGRAGRARRACVPSRTRPTPTARTRVATPAPRTRPRSGCERGARCGADARCWRRRCSRSSGSSSVRTTPSSGCSSPCSPAGHCLLEGVPGVAKTLAVRTLATVDRRHVLPPAVHPRPGARRHRRHPDLAPVRRGRSTSSSARSSPPSCSPTRSTARRRRCSPRCWRRWPSGRCRSAGAATRCPRRSWCWPRRTRSSPTACTSCRRPSATGSCSRSTWATRRASRS